MKTLLLGDVSPTVVSDPLFQMKDVETLFTDTATLFEGNDVNFVNLECALTDSDADIEKFGPPLKGCTNTAETLRLLGVNYCGLSNNHVFDYGIKGIQDTLEALDRAGIGYTGFGDNYEDSRKNLVIESQGEKICIIAVCEHEYSYALDDRMGSRPFDEYHTMEDIRHAKEQCDRVIVIYHGGKEHCKYPSPRLRRIGQAMARNGADVVLCQHSHCIGCYEEYEGCHILYGQGNFHFIKPGFADESLAKTWNNALAVKYDTKSHHIEFIPVVVEGSGMALAKGEQKEAILAAFAERNQELLDGKWVDGWKAFCQTVKGYYLEAIKNACTENATEHDNKLFGHYLDCEAHTDVWRELFPTANQTNER